MSYFSVKMDGLEIYNPDYPEMTLINAVSTAAIGEAGNMDFTFPVGHVYEKSLIPYGSTIEVFEDNVSVFYGRPLPPTIDIWGQKKVHCEGALAFLGDVICPPDTPGLNASMDDGQYYAFLIAYYNSKQTRADRKLIMGAAPSGGISRKREWSFRSCLDELRNNIIPYTGGYVYTRRDGDATYIEWTTDFTREATQPVMLGLNLIDITRSGRQFFTAAIAKGAGDARMANPVSMTAAIMQKYGFICASLDYPAVETVAALYEKCATFLSEQQFSGMDFTIDALDLHVFGHHDMLKLGEVVTVKFSELDDPVKIPIKSIQTNINTGVKKITVAFPASTELRSYIKAATISGISTDTITAWDTSIQNIDITPADIGITDPTGQYHYFIDEFGNVIAEHVVAIEVTDPETGEEITKYEPEFEKVPNDIEIVPNPENPPPEEYASGDVFDPDQYRIQLTYGDGTTELVTPDVDGFNIEDGYVFDGTELDPSTLTYSDTIGGKTLEAGFDLNQGESDAPPAAITIDTSPAKVSYLDGDTIDITGIAVSARKEDGTLWSDSRYPQYANGIVPSNELTYSPTVMDGSIFNTGEVVWIDSPSEITFHQKVITTFYVDGSYNGFKRIVDYNVTLSFTGIKCVALLRSAYHTDVWRAGKDLFAFLRVVGIPETYGDSSGQMVANGTYSASYENAPSNFDEFTAIHFKVRNEQINVQSEYDDFMFYDGETQIYGDYHVLKLDADRYQMSTSFGTAESPVFEFEEDFNKNAVGGHRIGIRQITFALDCNALICFRSGEDSPVPEQAMGSSFDYYSKNKTKKVTVSWTEPINNNVLSTEFDIILDEGGA